MKNFTQSFLNFTKICLLLMGIFVSGNALFAQKVALIGLDHSSNVSQGGTPFTEMDGFSFVATQNIAAGDIIYITNAYYSSANTRFRVSSNTAQDDPNKWLAKYTVPAGGITKGTVVKFLETGTNTNVLGVTCSSGSCGTVSLIALGANPVNFQNPAGQPMSIFAYEKGNDDPYSGTVTTVHSVLYDGYLENATTVIGGTIPAAMNPSINFSTCIVLDGFPTTLPNAGFYTTIDFKTSLRTGAVSKISLEDPSNYDVYPPELPERLLSTTAFSNLNLVNVNPTVSVAVSPSSVLENSGSLVYTFTLSAVAGSNITVNYTTTGSTATSGSDYTALSGSVVITTGNNTATVTVNPTDDATLEPNESLILTVSTGTGYDVGSPSVATGTITNDDTDTGQPKVAISGLNHGALPSDVESFSFAALEDIAAGTKIYFTDNAYDKLLLKFTNESKTVFEWTAPATVNRGDVYVISENTDGGNAFTLTCSDGSGCGSVAVTQGSGMTFPPNGTTLIAFSDSNTDPFTGTTPIAGQIHSVIYTGTASTPGGTLLAANNPSSIYPNAVITENFPAVAPVRTEYKFASGERAVSINRSLFTNPSSWLHAASSQTVSTVRFANIIITTGVALPQVLLNVSPSSVVENSGNTMTYTFTLSQNATSDLTVNFSFNNVATLTTDYTVVGSPSSGFTYSGGVGTIRILTGTNSATITLTPVGETLLEGNEAIIVTTTTGTGYDVGSPSVATGTIINDDFLYHNPLVAIIGINAGTISNQNPDGFSFVANQNLAAGQEVFFTSNAFSNTSLSFATTGFFVSKFTVGTGGLAKGQVVYAVETGATTNAFTVTCSAGSNCGTLANISGDFTFASGGAKLSAYSDADNDPTNGVLLVHSTFTTFTGTIPTAEDPRTVYTNAVVVDGFNIASPDRTEHKFASNERSSPVNLTSIQSATNYLVGQTTQALSVVPFAALNLCETSVTTNPSNAILCAGTNTSFTVAASGAVAYQWQVNTGSGFTNIANGGIYSGATSATLTLTAVPFANNGFTYQCVVNGCATSTAATLTVNATPTATASSNSPVCVGGTINFTGGSAGNTYAWSGPSFSPTTQNPSIANATAGATGIYTIRVTSVNSCTSTATTSVTVNPLPSAPTSISVTPSVVCTSATVTLSASGCAGTLSWFDAADNSPVSSTPTVSSSKSFYAKCTVGICTSVASGNVSVTVVTPAPSSPGNVGINWTGLVSTDWNTACNWSPAWVPDATNSAVVIGLQTNQPTITGTVPTVNQIYVNANATLTVSSGGTLNSNSTVAVLTLQGGNLINDGTINVSGGGSGVGISIGATASITNRGTITTNNLYGISLQFGSLTFTNESTGIFSGDFKANTNILTLTNRGTINYAGGTFALSLGSNGSSVVNTGTISITAGSGISNPSGSTITNNACGKILMTTGDYQNGGTTTNAGLIQMPDAFNFTNTGTFTNNGVLKANTVASITNNKMVITNACPIFTLGGTNNYTVSGIFTEAASAGTYTSVGNKFTANNTIATGSQILFAQVTDGTCTFIVPFGFNNVKPTTVSVNNTTICTGGSVTLLATCASGTPTWYTTATGGSNIGTGTSLSNSPTVATTYYAACETASCASGRVATSAVSVSSPPTASASSNSPVCAGTTLSLIGGSSGNTYLWAGPNSFTSTAQSPSITSVTNFATGTYTITVTNANNCTSTATVAVTVNASPAATASSNSPVCAGNAISLTGGGVGTYQWNGPNGFSSNLQSPTIASATVSATGTYTITVTGVGICISSATTAVTINGTSTANATPSTQTICSGEAITTIAITGTGENYIWTRDNVGTCTAACIGGIGSGNISGSLTNITEEPVTVTFTITPISNGCNGTAITATVVVNPIPTITASTPSQSICSGANITGITFNIPPLILSLLPDPSSDIVPVAPKTAKGIVFSSFVVGTVFNWTRDNTATVTGGIPASGSGNISGFLNNTTALPVTVTFTITPSYTNAGKTCDGTPITVTVTVNPNPASATITDAGTAFCSGSSTTLSAPADPNYTYKWERSLTGIANPNEFTTFGGTAQTQVITTSGVYRVIVTNQYNCSARDTTAVKFGDIVFSGLLGAGDAQQTGRMNRFAVASTCAAPKSYPGTFTTSGARFYDSYTVANPTNAPVCATIGLTSGCGTNIFSAAYLGSFNPASVNTNYLADHGSSFSFTAFYEAIIPANGTIVVVVHERDVNIGCASYNLRIDVPGATIAPTASSNTPICEGNTLNLTSTGTGSYAWTGPNSFTSSAQNPSIANATTLATGTYTISVTNTNGCVFNATTAVTVNATPTATASSNSPICAGTTLNLTGGGVGSGTPPAYSWTSSNGFTSTAQSPTIANSTVSTTGTYTITVTNNGCTSTASVAVTVNALPTATASSNSPICAGNTLNLIGGGVGTYSWTSSNGFTSNVQSPTISSATVSASGTYTITVTNASGCTSTASVAVTVNALPTATASSNSPICVGNTISLTGGGVGNYLWTGPGGYTSSAQSPTITNAIVGNLGTYTITVTNANNCTSAATVAVTVNPNPIATASNNSPICAGTTLNLTGGGVGTYSWTGVNGFNSTDQNPTIPNATVSASGTYRITVTNVSGCTSTAMTSVTINPNPTATASSNTPICAGTTLTLTGGGIGTYSWTGPNGYTSTAQNPTISNSTVLSSGVYKIMVTNVNNCTSTATTSVTVNPLPVVDGGANQTICEGSTASLTAICNLLTFNTTLSGASEVPANASTATGNVSGTYDKVSKQLLLTFTFNGLAVNASAAHLHKGAIGINGGVVIGFSGVPAATSGSFTYTGTLTSFQETDLLAGLYYANIHNASFPGGEIRGQLSTACVANNFVWNPGNLSGQSVTVSPTLTQTYTVTASNTTTGCLSTATTTVNVNPRPVVTIGSNTPVCAGNTLNLTASVGSSDTPATFAWTGVNGFNSTAQNPSIASVTLLATGTYTVTVTNVNGCTNSATTVVVINALPIATASNNSPICSGITLKLTGGGIGTYAWAGPSGYSSTEQSPSIPSATASMSGTYTITVTNANGCTSTATTSVMVNPVTATPTPQANTQIIFGGSITLTATGCSGVNDVLKWYKSSDNTLAVMPVSPTATTNFYAKCETTLNGITCISGNSVDVTVTVLSPNPPEATGATNCVGTPTTLTAKGCSGSVGTFVLKWYQNSNDALVTMPVSPLVSTDYYARCEQTFNAVTAVSGKSNVVTLTILNPPTPVSTGGTIYIGQSISLTATGCTGTLGTFTLKWYQTSDNVLVTMPVSPTVTTQYYAKCEQTANAITCLSPKSNDVAVTVVNRIFVDITKITAPIQNGNSWATAYGNLQTGLAAATAGVEVWVAKGTYKPTSTFTRTIYFNIPNNVKVYGGFAGTEDNLIDRNFRTNVSILSGDIGVLNIDTDNSYHVVVMNGLSNTTVLDGFTVTGGYANFDPQRVFSATLTSASTSTIETGGGIVVQNGGSPVIANCIIIKNAAVTGGGLYAGDASKPTITSCKIMGNQAGFGSGIYFQDDSNGKVNNSLISGNRGIGGVYNNNSNPMFTNVTFAGNGGYNGGIFNSNSKPVVKNSIIWGNSTPFNDTQSIITYSTIQGGYAGVGNLSMNPKFVSLTPEGLSPNLSGDYHVQAISLTIDRGDNGTISLTDKDLDGNLRRFAGGRVDMGTYEFQGIATATLIISVQTGDWEINSTWDLGRVPQLGDYVIIDNNHIVTLSTIGIAKNLEYRGTGKLKFNTNTSKLEIGF